MQLGPRVWAKSRPRVAQESPQNCPRVAREIRAECNVLHDVFPIGLLILQLHIPFGAQFNTKVLLQHIVNKGHVTEGIHKESTHGSEASAGVGASLGASGRTGTGVRCAWCTEHPLRTVSHSRV